MTPDLMENAHSPQALQGYFSVLREYGGKFISEPGFSCMADILIKLRKLYPTIQEIPLILIV